jgi:hypothetical protein
MNDVPSEEYQDKLSITPVPKLGQRTTRALVAAMQQIADWFKRLGLGQYAPCFGGNDIDFSILHDLIPPAGGTMYFGANLMPHGSRHGRASFRKLRSRNCALTSVLRPGAFYTCTAL